MENLTAAHSRVHDANMAKELVSYTSSSIISQAGEAMLAQANQRPQAILRLLQ
jgi:flagellin